ncbi:ferredoxin--NADP reductase [Paenirhodobacter enshiensis]|uniref:ferredoxin--NADP(+) reductase n=1 Tax=Paenirhodobacter enshiensis TaxID=1105367 RepID=A0A086XVR7_9RHOB|nr:ferredoxin--NADP reductase [Paenirhodobacter enshiensis]KFI26117.1 ferredoxin-NADP reductase [Paenirhodobacter enshiensis]
MKGYNTETVLSVRHWTDRLFSFSLTRDPGFRFSNGHFTMIGLETGERPVLRAYSIASPNYDDHLEFFSIKVPDGPLTSKLQHIRPGDRVLVGRKPTGTLLIDYLLPGRRLYLMATGTGLAPFLSILRDPETYEKFDQVILTHGVRQVSELAFRDFLSQDLPQDEILGEIVSGHFSYLPTVTREPFGRQGRITDLLASGRLTHDAGMPELDPGTDRVMICGSMGLNADLTAALRARGFTEGNTSTPGSFVVEKAFVDA